MNLYEKLVDTFTKIADNDQVIVLGKNNQVPELLAEAAIKVVYEHQNEEDNSIH